MMKSLKYKISKNSYSLFLFKLICLLTVLIIVDRVVGGVLRHFYFKQTNGTSYLTTYALDSTKADILIFGSSRANHHYRPDLFENNYKMSCYNTGRDGSHIFYYTGLLKGVLSRYSPKIVVLDILRDEFANNGEVSYDRLSALLPYYQDHPEMRPVIELKSKFEKLKLTSHIYPYNSRIFAIAAGNTTLKARRKNYKGYIPLDNITSLPLVVKNSRDFELDSVKVGAYEMFIKTCVDSNIDVYVVCSPYYIKYMNSSNTLNKAKEIADRYNVRFLDFSNAPTTTENKYFSDQTHLNDDGAEAFTETLLDSISIAR